MMQEVEVLKTIQELICSFFSEEQFTLSSFLSLLDMMIYSSKIDTNHQYSIKNRWLVFFIYKKYMQSFQNGIGADC